MVHLRGVSRYDGTFTRTRTNMAFDVKPENTRIRAHDDGICVVLFYGNDDQPDINVICDRVSFNNNNNKT